MVTGRPSCCLAVWGQAPASGLENASWDAQRKPWPGPSHIVFSSRRDSDKKPEVWAREPGGGFHHRFAGSPRKVTYPLWAHLHHSRRSTAHSEVCPTHTQRKGDTVDSTQVSNRLVLRESPGAVLGDSCPHSGLTPSSLSAPVPGALWEESEGCLLGGIPGKWPPI